MANRGHRTFNARTPSPGNIPAGNIPAGGNASARIISASKVTARSVSADNVPTGKTASSWDISGGSSTEDIFLGNKSTGKSSAKDIFHNYTARRASAMDVEALSTRNNTSTGNTPARRSAAPPPSPLSREVHSNSPATLTTNAPTTATTTTAVNIMASNQQEEKQIKKDDEHALLDIIMFGYQIQKNATYIGEWWEAEQKSDFANAGLSNKCSLTNIEKALAGRRPTRLTSFEGHILIQADLTAHIQTTWAKKIKVGNEVHARLATQLGFSLWQICLALDRKLDTPKNTLPALLPEPEPIPDSLKERLMYQRTSALIKVLGYQLVYQGIVPHLSSRACDAPDVAKWTSRRETLLSVICLGNDTIKTLLPCKSDHLSISYPSTPSLDVDKVIDKIIQNTALMEDMLWKSHKLMNRVLATGTKVEPNQHRTTKEWISYLMHRMDYLALRLYYSWLCNGLEFEATTIEIAKLTVESGQFDSKYMEPSATGALLLAEVAMRIAGSVDELDGCFGSATDWYQLALTCLAVPCPRKYVETAHSMKKETILSMTHCMALTRTPANLKLAAKYLHVCASEFKADFNIAVVTLELVSISRPEKIYKSFDNLVRSFAKMKPTRETVYTVMKQVNKMEATETIYKIALLEHLWEKIIGVLDDDRALHLVLFKRILLTLEREDDDTEEGEGILLDLTKFVDKVHPKLARPVPEEILNVVLLWLWKPVEILFSRGCYEAVEKWCGLIMHPMFEPIRDVYQVKIYRTLVECSRHGSREVPQGETAAAAASSSPENNKPTVGAEMKKDHHECKKDSKRTRKKTASGSTYGSDEESEESFGTSPYFQVHGHRTGGGAKEAPTTPTRMGKRTARPTLVADDNSDVNEKTNDDEKGSLKSVPSSLSSSSSSSRSSSSSSAADAAAGSSASPASDGAGSPFAASIAGSPSLVMVGRAHFPTAEEDRSSPTLEYQQNHSRRT